MGKTTRFIVRWGIISGLALGGITLLVGPQRVAACFSQLRTNAQTLVEDMVDDPVALRHQLDELARQYPTRIADIRGELARIDQQVSQFERDEHIAARVVALTTEDLEELRQLVASTESNRAVAIRFDGVRYDLDGAYAEGRRIRTVRASYEDRLASDRKQVRLLHEQRAHLASMLEKLEHEREEYQAQVWHLDREIDAIERNERIIEMVEDQRATLASFDRLGHVGNLDQVRSRLAEIRTVQESTIAALAETGRGDDYETEARYQLGGKGFDDPFSGPSAEDSPPHLPARPFALLDEVSTGN
ncbi:MAG: hypothetical protein QGH76_04995 [Phycisphaerales bacterium]|jgi:hypothetical protein|nr:hypothetical protein [Phycisphaerales bacterium]